MVSQLNYKQTEIGKIPKEWRILKIRNILSLEYGEGLTANNRRGDKYPVYGSNGIIGYHSKNLVEGPGIIVGRKGTIGSINWSEVNYWPIDTTYYIKLKGTEINLKWLSNKLLTLNLSKLNTATGTPGLNRDLVYRLNISIPPLQEQKKIADILLTVDHSIDEVDKSIAKTERLKKGLMQELLTKGIGHKEFKETEIGKIPKEWGILRIKDIGKVLTGKTPATSESIYWNGDIPFITPEDMTDCKYVSESKRYVSKEGANKVGKILPKNTLLVVCIGSTVGKVAITGRKSITNQQINAVICKDNINYNYLYYIILFKSQILKNFSGVAAVPIIKKSLFEIFEIPLPKKQEEQKKIAEILSTVDERIQLLKDKKNKLRRVKKGLMNELLTGRKRVKVEA